jgi:hypothetical protein
VTDLQFRFQQVLGQLTRHSSGPAGGSLVDALEALADLNDDMEHGRDPQVCRDALTRIRAALDQIEREL